MPEVVEALYAYSPQSGEDLELQPGNRIEVQQHLSSDWARGRNVDTGKEGVFPTNYVKPVKNDGHSDFNRPPVAVPQNSGPQPFDEKQGYNAPPPPSWQQQSQQQPPQYEQHHSPQQYQPPQQQYQPPQQQYQPPQQQYQPPPQQYQQPEPQAQPQPQQHRQHRFGGLARRFGDSVMFGAGATLGSDIINKIF